MQERRLKSVKDLDYLQKKRKKPKRCLCVVAKKQLQIPENSWKLPRDYLKKKTSMQFTRSFRKRVVKR